MAKVAQQRARGPLGRVVLALRQTVVDEQRDAAREWRRYRREPSGEPQTELRGVALRPVATDRDVQASRGGGERRRRRGLRPAGAPVTQGDPERPDRAFPQHEALYRQRIEDFVGEDHALEALGRPVQPVDATEQPRHARGERRPLPLPQVGAHVEHEIALRQAVAALEFGEHLGRKCA